MDFMHITTTTVTFSSLIIRKISKLALLINVAVGLSARIQTSDHIEVLRKNYIK